MRSFFDPETIRLGCEIGRAMTDASTKRTREAIARGETPDLVGALTANDLLNWIENAKAKKARRQNNRTKEATE